MIQWGQVYSTPIKNMVSKETRKKYVELLDGLSADYKDKTIYRIKYGLDDGIYKSNLETALLFRLTGEAVRQATVRISKFIGIPSEE
jgi:hypothetical protein